MKGRVIALAATPPAAALLVDGRLEDVIVSPTGGGPLPGAVLDATVTRVLPRSGAFCALEGGGEGYLRDAGGVREGARLRVMVQSLPEPGKALTLTTRLLRKGPRLILTPGAPGVNVSRRIGNEAERARLVAATEAALAGLAGLDGTGVIVRTEARDETAGRLAAELRQLAAAGPSPLAAPHDRGLCDWCLPLPDALVVTPGIARSLADPAALWGDERLAARLRVEADPFAALGIDAALDALAAPGTALGEGRMTVEATRALVAVDVDTGADFSPAAGLKINLAAARELPRQLRLRGLGGQIAVDFAPMPKADRRRLEEALARAFRADPVETQLAGWTPLGLFELRRKRERAPLGRSGR